MHPPETPDNYNIVAADEATHIYDTHEEQIDQLSHWTTDDEAVVFAGVTQMKTIPDVKKSPRYLTVERQR